MCCLLVYHLERNTRIFLSLLDFGREGGFKSYSAKKEDTLHAHPYLKPNVAMNRIIIVQIVNTSQMLRRLFSITRFHLLVKQVGSQVLTSKIPSKCFFRNHIVDTFGFMSEQMHLKTNLQIRMLKLEEC